MGYEWRWDVIWQGAPLLMDGLRYTVLMAVIVMSVSIALAAILAILSEYGPAPVRAAVLIYTEVFRAIPVLVLLVWVFWALPILLGVTLSPFTSGLLGLTLNVTAYVAEAFRAALVSIKRGQQDAAFALGMSTRQAIGQVMWPQTWRIALPVVGSYWVGLFKDTSLLSLIQYHELMFEGQRIANQSFRFVEALTAVAIIYFVAGYSQSRIVDELVRRVRTEE